MNFLLRSASSATHRPPVNEPPATPPQPPPETTKPGVTLEGLIAEEPFPQYPSVEDLDRVGDGSRDDDASGKSNAKSGGFGMERFSDVSEEEGWIAIPYKEISDTWSESVDIHSLRSLDRSFVFPGLLIVELKIHQHFSIRGTKCWLLVFLIIVLRQGCICFLFFSVVMRLLRSILR